MSENSLDGNRPYPTKNIINVNKRKHKKTNYRVITIKITKNKKIILITRNQCQNVKSKSKIVNKKNMNVSST